MSTEKDQEGLDKNPETEALKKGKQQSSEEIDLIEVVFAFWKERRILYITLGVFAVIGLIIAFTSAKEYSSEVKLLPEERQQQRGTGGLARQFGLGNIQTQEEGIATQYYPNIAKSILFIQPILDHKVYVGELNDSLTIERYFNDHYSEFNLFSEISSIIADYTIRLPFTIQGWLKGSNAEEESDNPKDNGKEDGKPEIIDSGVADFGLSHKMELTANLSRSELRAINKFKERIEVERDEEGILIVSVKMPDPVLAAELTGKVTESLTDYIKDYRTEKARQDMEFTRERYKEARESFKKAQERLARFRDEHSGQLTQMARTHEELLQSEYDVTFNVYNNLAERLEQERLEVQKETPVVKVLEPATIPSGPTHPTKEFLFIIYLMLGFFVGNGIIFGKLVRRKIKETIRKRGLE